MQPQTDQTKTTQEAKEDLAQQIYDFYKNLYIPIIVNDKNGNPVDIADDYAMSLLSIPVPGFSYNDLKFFARSIKNLLEGTEIDFEKNIKPTFEFKGSILGSNVGEVFNVPVDEDSPFFVLFVTTLSWYLQQFNPFTFAKEFSNADGFFGKLFYLISKALKIFLGWIFLPATLAWNIGVSTLYKIFQLVKPFIPLFVVLVSAGGLAVIIPVFCAFLLLIVLPISCINSPDTTWKNVKRFFEDVANDDWIGMLKNVGKFAGKPIANFLASIINLGLRVLCSPLLLGALGVKMFERFKETPIYQQVDTWIDSMKQNYEELKSAFSDAFDHLFDGKDTAKNSAPKPAKVAKPESRPVHEMTERVFRSMEETADSASSKLRNIAESISQSMSEAKTSVSTTLDEMGTAMSRQVDALKAKFSDDKPADKIELSHVAAKLSDMEKMALLESAPAAPKGDFAPIEGLKKAFAAVFA